jgi:hypothetical protein
LDERRNYAVDKSQNEAIYAEEKIPEDINSKDIF